MNIKNRIAKLEKKQIPMGGGVVVRLSDGSGYMHRNKFYKKISEIPSGPGGFLLVPETLKPEQWKTQTAILPNKLNQKRNY